MPVRKHPIFSQILIFFLVLSSFSNTVYAKSIYAITNHASSIVTAYDINDVHIDYQTTAKDLPNHGYGAVGLALDPDSETLFVTYEKISDPLDKIEIINAKTMVVEEAPATAPGASNLAGIVFDQAKQKLYAVDRRTNKLFVYLWNPYTKTLTLEGGTHKTLAELPTPKGAYGIALDPNDAFLYVTDSTNIVRYYDTNDPNFGYKGSIEIT